MALKTDELLNAFPPGVILPWYKKSGAFPAGWAVCDGTNGTPDLRKRFLMGVSDMADVGKPGGANLLQNLQTGKHPLAIDEIPAHTHTQKVQLHQGPDGAPDGNEYSPGGPTGATNNWSWRGSETSSKGEGHGHMHDIADVDNRPAYDTVIFIMKL